MIGQKKEKEDTLVVRDKEVRVDIKKVKRKDRKIKKERRRKRVDVDHHLTLDLVD